MSSLPGYQGVTAGGNTRHHNWPHAAPACLGNSAPGLASGGEAGADGVKYRISHHVV